MSFPRYPAYKDSGVEWVGQVPTHWQVAPFRAAVVERDESNAGMKEDNLLSLSYGRIIAKDMSSNDGLLPESFETYQIVRPGDIVLRLTDLQNDKRSLRSGVVSESGIITSAYLAVAPTAADSRFLNYLLRAYDVAKVFYSMGGGLRQSMKFADLKAMPTVLPPSGEQAAIAAFLDRETAKIDALITEQKRLIELLKEKRQAVISHAVIKGLNPDAPMQASGIEWLGDVPAHWAVMPLKRLAELIDGDRSSTYPSDEDLVVQGVPFLSSKNIVGCKFASDNLKFISEQKFASLSRGKIRGGDLAITVRGTIGHVAIFDPEVIGYPTAFINAQMMIIRPTGVTASFIHSVTESEYWKTQLQIASYGTAQQQLSNLVLQQVSVAVPPPKEREEICRFLSTELGKLDNLIELTQSAMSLLHERRSAIVSAAVSGQIDVRIPRPSEAT